MPDFSKMFAKRLSEDDYDQLKTYLDGKTTFNQVGSEAQKVLKAITKPENDRTFDEQEKLFELKTKLITDKYIQDSPAWDQFELVYRTFLLGAAARQKFFNVKKVEVGLHTSTGGKYPRVPGFIESDYQKLKAFYEGDLSFSQLNTLQRRVVDAVFREEMSEDPDSNVLQSMLKETKKKGKKKPGRPDYLVEDKGDGAGGVKVSGIKRLKPLISQSEIDKAKIWEAKDNAERLRKGGRGKGGGDVEMQELLLGDEELRNPYWNVEDIIAEDDFPIPVERYIRNKRITPIRNQRGPMVVEMDDFSAEPIMKELTQLDATFEWSEIAGRKMLKLGTWALKTLSIGALWSSFFAQFNNVIQDPSLSMYIAISASVMEALLTRDPTSALVMGATMVISKVIEEFAKQRQRALLNDHPQDVLGSKFGKLRVNGVFYPCFLSGRYTDPGFGSRSDTISLVYGTGLHWVKDKDGTIRPEFAWEKRKTLKSDDSFITSDKHDGRKEQIKDPLRDFYFLTEAQTQKLFEDPNYRREWESIEKDDPAKYLGDKVGEKNYLNNLLNLKKTLDIIQTQTSSRRPDEGLVSDTSFASSGLDRDAALWVSERNRQPETYKGLGDMRYVLMEDFKKYGVSKGYAMKYKGRLPGNEWLLNETIKHLTLLSKTQKEAAIQSKFGKAGGRIHPKGSEGTSFINPVEPWRNYLDLSKSQPVAKTSEELSKQFKTIDNYKDRTPEQKNYLTQKAISRALMFQINERAGGDELYNSLGVKGTVLGTNEGGWEYNEHRNRTYDQSALGSLAWEQDERQYLPAWFSTKDVSMLPHFMDYKSHDRDKMTLLFRDIVKNSKQLDKDSNMAYHVPGEHSKWSVDIHGEETILVPKYRGKGAKDQYFRKLEEMSETDAEKKARLRAKKELRKHPVLKDVKDTRPGFYHHQQYMDRDIKNRRDPWYLADPTTHWDDFVKVWVKTKLRHDVNDPVPGKKPLGKPKNVTWEQRFGNMENKNKFGGHGTVGLDPKKTKLEKLGDDKGRDSRKKELEKKRALDRLKASSEQARIHSDNFAKKRKHHGMNYYEYKEFIKDHDGKTPDQVYKQGAWKVSKNGGVKTQTTTTTTTVIPKTVAKIIIPKKDRVTSQYDRVTALQEYLSDQHGMNVSRNDINEKTLPFLAFDSQGNPLLYGDPVLHDKLGLPDAYRVVTGPTGYVHKSYDPSLVQPKVFGTHETSVVERY